MCIQSHRGPALEFAIHNLLASRWSVDRAGSAGYLHASQPLAFPPIANNRTSLQPVGSSWELDRPHVGPITSAPWVGAGGAHQTGAPGMAPVTWSGGGGGGGARASQSPQPGSSDPAWPSACTATRLRRRRAAPATGEQWGAPASCWGLAPPQSFLSVSCPLSLVSKRPLL
jgi:hypothetical protein